LKRLGRLDLAIWIVTLPVYLLLVSAACWRALFELWLDPQMPPNCKSLLSP